MASLQKRVVGILTNPKAEWPEIAAEQADVASIYRNYILILAAIPAVGALLGVGMLSSYYALSAAIAAYVSAVVTPIVAAVVIEKLAPKFGSGGDTAQALKLVAYASTPVWMAGILYATIILSPLVLIAVLYAIYLFYLGLGPVLKTPPEQVVPFMVVAAIVVVVVTIVLQFILGIFGIGRMIF